MAVSKMAKKWKKKKIIAPMKIRTHDLYIMSPTPYQLRHDARWQFCAN